MNNWENSLSYKVTHNRPSPLGSLLSLARQPGIISFAVGSPASEVFPINEFYECCDILKDRGSEILQYGTTEGNIELREFLLDFCAKRLGRKANLDEIILTTGSQQALDLFGWAILDPGDIVICEDPSYMAALAAFSNHGGIPFGIPCDADGMLVERIPAAIEKLREEGKTIKFLYTVVNFQNPGGMTMSVERRKKLAAMAEEYGFVIFEDDPYGYVRYEGEHLPSIYSFDKSGNTLYAGSFSKIFAPGSRIGWVIAPPQIISKLCTFKQSTDICTSTICQALIAEYCKRGFLEKHLPVILDTYRQRRDAMEESLKRHLAPLGVTWVKPQGGFFYWIDIPGVDTDELGIKAVDKKVVIIPGSTFGAKLGTCRSNARVNFTYCAPSIMEEGMKRLAMAIKELQDSKK